MLKYKHKIFSKKINQTSSASPKPEEIEKIQIKDLKISEF